MLRKLTQRKVFNIQAAPEASDPFRAAATEATRARRPSDGRLQPNITRSNSMDPSQGPANGIKTVLQTTRASLARLSRQPLPGTLDESEALATQALKITSQAKGRFDAIREAAYRVFTLKGQIESNRYQLDRKRQDIQLLVAQLQSRGRQKSRRKVPSAEELQYKQRELEGHVVNLQRKEEELLETHRLALDWLQHWIRYSVSLQTAEEAESTA